MGGPCRPCNSSSLNLVRADSLAWKPCGFLSPTKIIEGNGIDTWNETDGFFFTWNKLTSMYRGHVPELSERKETSCREWEWSPFEITGLIEIREEKEDQENWRLTILSHNSKRVNISRQFPFVEIPSISISQPTWTIFEEFQTLAHARKSSTSDDRSSFLAARFFEYEANLEALPFEDGLKGVREKSAGHLLLREEGRGESCSRIFITGHEQRHDKSKNSSPRAGDELLGFSFRYERRGGEGWE